MAETQVIRPHEPTAVADRTIPRGANFLKPSSLCAKLDRSRSWLWNRVKTDPSFAEALVYIDDRSPVFVEEKIDEWVAEQAARSAVTRAHAGK